MVKQKEEKCVFKEDALQKTAYPELAPQVRFPSSLASSFHFNLQKLFPFPLDTTQMTLSVI